VSTQLKFNMGAPGDQDPRFAAIAKDPRFARFPRKHNKVKVDDRFKGVAPGPDSSQA
jgi:hypothetical protein